MGPHSGDTVSDPSNRGMGLKIQGQLMLACVQPGRPLTPKKKRVLDFFWEGAVSTYATLITPNFHSGQSRSLFPLHFHRLHLKTI